MRDQNISYTGETGEDLDHTFATVVEQKCHKGKDNEDLDTTFHTGVEEKCEKRSRFWTYSLEITTQQNLMLLDSLAS